MTLARTERDALADLFLTLGPDQPTLCEGWETGDLLTHLLVRERRPDGAAGVVLSPLAGWTAKVAAGYAAKPFADQVALYRSGPPAWNPMGWGKLDELTNGAEMLIHHEDARRGQPGWQPRTLSSQDHAQAVSALTSFAKLGLRKVKVGVTAVLTDNPAQPEQTVVLRTGTPAAVIRGGVVDVLLWLAGRTEVVVELQGDPVAVRTLETANRGL